MCIRDRHSIGLADIEHKVLLLIGEQAADHIVGRDIALSLIHISLLTSMAI